MINFWNNLETIEDIVPSPIGTIFYVHSFMGNFQMKKSLRNYYRLYNFYAINLPGHGKSPIRSKEEIKVPYCINLIKEYIEYKKIDNLIMIGHSLGGGIIAALNNIIPNKIKLNIFEAPANGVMLDNIKIVKKLISDEINDIEFIFRQLYYDPQKMFGCRLNWIIQQEYEKNKKFKIFKENFELETVIKNTQIFDLGFKNIKKPSLIIIGEKDGILPMDLMINNIKQINNSYLQLKIIKNTAHAIYAEQKNIFLNMMDDFLQAHDNKK
ncbi:alpha/beta fold hydrolase [Mycoplasmoides alvi]|uniref:alpha/beta fold hydrolase n=1 Tax=Mycoplasmoides alvi TaxID=78580 RepID=UPI00051C79E0|nr:alpha/beta hydrolase [Mycoplasmoides alvi]